MLPSTRVENKFQDGPSRTISSPMVKQVTQLAEAKANQRTEQILKSETLNEIQESALSVTVTSKQESKPTITEAKRCIHNVQVIRKFNFRHLRHIQRTL